MEHSRKVAVVTGAGRGIGRAIARRFAAEGVGVAVLDANGTAAAATAAEIERGGGRALGLAADVTDETAVAEAVRRTCAELGGVHILVTAAGVSRPTRLLDMDRATWDFIIGVNLTGTFLATRAVAPHLVEQGWGRIVHIASTSAQRGVSYRSAYCASKGGVISFMQTCAVELAPFGVTVNAVSPGPVNSPMVERNHTPAIREAIFRVTPIRRYGEAEEIATAVSFLASDGAAYITGHELSVDGGFGGAGIIYKD